MSTMNTIMQGYILVEKGNRVSDVMMIEKNICAMIERVCFMIGEIILHVVLRK